MQQRKLDLIEQELAILSRLMITATTGIGNLDRSAYLLLHQIASRGSAGVKVLAEDFRLDISTVSRQTTTLEQKGYVERIPDPSDRRSYSLQLTELGTRELAESTAARQTLVRSLLSNWTDEECQSFGKLLQKFNRTVFEQLGSSDAD